jgi:hypothetical protein
MNIILENINFLIEEIRVSTGKERRVIRGQSARPRRRGIPMAAKLKINEARAMNKLRNKYRIKIAAAKARENINAQAKRKLRGSR